MPLPVPDSTRRPVHLVHPERMVTGMDMVWGGARARWMGPARLRTAVRQTGELHPPKPATSRPQGRDSRPGCPGFAAPILTERCLGVRNVSGHLVAEDEKSSMAARTERIEARITPDEHTRIKRAAALEHTSTGNFVTRDDGARSTLDASRWALERS